MNPFNYIVEVDQNRLKRVANRASYSTRRKSVNGALVVKVPKNNNPELPFESRMVMEVKAVDLENLILKHFGRPYKILSSTQSLAGKVCLEISNPIKINYVNLSHFKMTGQGSNLLGDLLGILVLEGLALPGIYIIGDK